VSPKSSTDTGGGSSSLTAIRRQVGLPLAMVVYDSLREAIVSVRLPPGAALSENELANHLQVSRTPIREALKRLADERLVEIYPQTATVVARIDMAAVEEAQFIREALEVAVVGRAAQNASDDQIAKLEKIVEEQRDCNQRGDIAGFYARDELLHASCSEICNFKNAWRVARAVKPHLDRVRRLSLPLPHQIDALIEQHAAIVDGVRRHDVEAAQQLMRQHLREVLRVAPAVQARHPEYFS
jgi:DNA-binding GntR family transcriptional regulator